MKGSICARIVTDQEPGSAKGFGFIDFNSEEDAQVAMEAIEDGESDGHKVTVDWAKPHREGGFGEGRGGRGRFGGRGQGGLGGRGGFQGARAGEQRTKFENSSIPTFPSSFERKDSEMFTLSPIE